jgi:starvation-inducible DNA-binding protein
MALKTDLGISDTKGVAGEMSKVLADSYLLYLKTQNYHWNVKGPMFRSLHLMFEEQYQDLAGAVDEIAERIRAIGHPAPGSFRAFSNLGSIQEAGDDVAADQMITDLVKDNEAVAKTARSAFEVCEKAGDEASADLLTQRMAAHEKAAWMLRALKA